MSFESRRLLRPPPRVPLGKLGGQGYALDTVQRNVEKATEKSRALPQTKGKTITVRTDAAGAFPQTVRVSHGLGRKPKGWNQTNISAPSSVSSDDSSWSTRSMEFVFSADATLTAWVY